MELSNLTFCYEGVQRIYRNAIVEHVRTSLTVAFGSLAADKVARPFKADEWAAIRYNASFARETGLVSAPVADDFDLLSVSHFYNLFDAYRSELAPALQPPAHKKLLEFLKTIKDVRDPQSHPPTADFSKADSFMLLDTCRRVLEQLGLPGSTKLKALADQVMYGAVMPLTVRERDPLQGRLPPREAIVVDFVGRAEELVSVRQWFDDPQSRLWALGGEGGRGKSALAYHFASEVVDQAPEPYDVVLWLSAKRRRFHEGETVSIDAPDFSDLSSALDQILIQYGWIAETDLDIARKSDIVCDLLLKFPALIVVDDVDSLSTENEDVIDFFANNAAHTRSKVLFTSRRTMFGLGSRTTQVKGFTEAEVDAFIRSRCSLWDIDHSIFSKASTRELLEITEGSPLYLEDLLRLAGAIPLSEAMLAWRRHRGVQARRYALGRELEMLSSEAKQVLFSACVSSVPVSFIELQDVSGFQEEVVTRALQELQKLFLVPKPRLVNGEQRYEVGVNTKSLIREVEGSTDSYRRVEAARRAVMVGLPKGQGEIGAIIRQATLLVKRDEHLAAEQLLDQALDKHPNIPDLIAFKAWVYKQWKPQRTTDARECFRRAYQLRCLKEEMYKHWALMESDRHELTSAIEATSFGLKRLPGSRRLLYLQGFFRSKLGQDLLRSMVQDKGMKELTLARSLLEQALLATHGSRADERSLGADIYRALVITGEWMQDLPMVKRYLDVWLREHPTDQMVEFEWRRLVAKFPGLGLPRIPVTPKEAI